jgi:hypothetical protein
MVSQARRDPVGGLLLQEDQHLRADHHHRGAVLVDRSAGSLLDGTGVNANDDFSITNVINTPGGPLKGFELNYQQPLDFLPEAFRGFGVLANYTYVDSNIDYFATTAAGAATISAPLLNLSKNAYNATLYYERGKVQARVSVATIATST